MNDLAHRYGLRKLPPTKHAPDEPDAPQKAKPAALLSSDLRELASQLQADGALIYWNWSVSLKRYTGFEARFSDGRQAIGVEEQHD